jgi:transposase
MLFSLVETAKAKEIYQQALLKFLFESFPAAPPPGRHEGIMPLHVDKSLLLSLSKPRKKKNSCPLSHRGAPAEDADA